MPSNNELTFHEISANGTINKIANLFDTPANANLLLEKVDYPQEHTFRFDTPLEFWRQTCIAIEKGLTPGGLQYLIQQIPSIYPNNAYFSNYFSGAAFSQNTKQQKGNGEYDIFLSYNSTDRKVVRFVAENLIGKEIYPWYDQISMHPGEPVVTELENALTGIKAAAFFIGQNGIGGWQKQEINIAINLHAKREFTVIPVLLNGVNPDKLTPFLAQFKALAFKEEFDSSVPVDLAAIMDKLNPKK